MGELNDIIFEAFERYFKVLESVGYIPESDVNKLLLLQFLQEFMQEYSYYITEKDCNIIGSIVQCITQNSCLVPQGECKQLVQPLINYIFNTPVRITEGSIPRYIETFDNVRLVNQ